MAYLENTTRNRRFDGQTVTCPLRVYIPSRYKALKAIVGEDAADLMLNELAILQCTGIGKGRAA